MATPSPELRDFLSRTPFFGGLEEPALDRIIAMLGEKRFGPGDAVFREGEKGGAMYVVHMGQLIASRATPASNVRLRHFRPGDFFGEMTLIEAQPRPYTVLAEIDTSAFELTKADFYTLYREDVNAYVMVLQNINREMSRRLRSADARMAELANEIGDEVTQIDSTRARRS